MNMVLQTLLVKECRLQEINQKLTRSMTKSFCAILCIENDTIDTYECMSIAMESVLLCHYIVGFLPFTANL